jgi:aminodeoxychorismate lyase
MIVFLNGKFVPEERAVVSVFDRSFLYGDGLFETILVSGGRLVRWTQHLERLRAGATFLGIRVPLTALELHTVALELLARNHLSDGLLRLQLSRGVGIRGYSPKGADQPMIVMTLHPIPAADPAEPVKWRLVTASIRVAAGDRLARFKSCSKLPLVLARAEAEAAGADEALVLNTDGEVVEAAGSNLFWLADNALCTPPLEAGLLAGVTRAMVLEFAHALKWPLAERRIRPESLRSADGVFLTLSSFGIVPAISLDGVKLPQSNRVGELQRAFQRAVQG